MPTVNPQTIIVANNLFSGSDWVGFKPTSEAHIILIDNLHLTASGAGSQDYTALIF